jgi:hypothetical protein
LREPFAQTGMSYLALLFQRFDSCLSFFATAGASPKTRGPGLTWLGVYGQ